MAKNDHNRPDVEAGELAGILRGYGLNPKLFDDLIHEAIINQWSTAQFAGELYSSDEFAAAFPGIFNHDGSLKVSPTEYLRLAYGINGYQDIARQFGIKLGLNKIGQLFEGNVSPDEWAFKAMVLQQSRATETYRQEFNNVLESSGAPPLGKKEWFDFIAHKSEARVENLYEAVALRMDTGLELTPEEALAAAKQIGLETPSARVDINEIIAKANQYKGAIGPELRAAGITDADLVVLQSGRDPKGIRGQLEQILANREALINAPSGGGRRQSAFAAVREGL
jgi:hypothetical protein